MYMRMKSVGLALVLALMATSSPLASQAQPSASEAWVAAPAAGATTAIGYVSIDNPTMYEIYVVSVSSEMAGTVEMAQGSPDAATVVKELAVASFGGVALKPGGMFLRLSGLTKPLTAGDQVPLVLTTDGGVTMKVTAEVRRP